MELLSKLLRQKTFRTRPKIEEHILKIMHKSNHEENFCQPLQTKNKHFKNATTSFKLVMMVSSTLPPKFLISILKIQVTISISVKLVFQ